MTQFDRFLAAFFAEPVAMAPSAATWLLSLRGQPDKDIGSKLAAASRPRQQSRATGPAIVHIRGVIVREQNWLTEEGYATSAEQVGRTIDALAADPDVPAIVLDIDSPGGTVSGTPELGEKIAAARKVKRVVAAITGTYAASAAYWVASQASEVVISPGSEAGSVGVVLMHIDESEYLRQLGVKVSFVTAGDQKVAGNSFAPLDDAGRAEYQRRIDASYQDFVKAVADGRNVAQTKVRNEWGARLFPAKQAVALGLANRVGTLEDVWGKLTGTSSAGASASAVTTTPAAGPSSGHDVEIRRRRMVMNRGESSWSGGSKPAATPTTAAPTFPPHPRQVFVSYHEAGHLLVAVVLGDRDAHASIIADATSGGRVTPTKQFGHVENAALLYAGQVATLHSPEKSIPGGGDPAAVDEQMLAGIPYQARVLGRDKARQIVGRYSRELRVIANELHARKTLPGSFVVKLLQGL